MSNTGQKIETISEYTYINSNELENKLKELISDGFHIDQVITTAFGNDKLKDAIIIYSM